MHIMKQIFYAFDMADIKYAHFKSNTELEKSFLGKGDFDILVDSSRILEVEKILVMQNAKRFRTIREKTYPFVSSWLAFDNETGIIYHIHLHEKIVTGKIFLKDYIVPWEYHVLDTRVLDTKWNIYIANPNLEIILLAARSVLKSRNKDYLNALFGKYQLHNDLDKERKELIGLISIAEVKRIVAQLFPLDNNGYFISFCTNDVITGDLFLKLSKVVRDELRNSRRYSVIVASVVSLFNRFTYWLRNHIVLYFNSNIIIKKTPPERGLIIALVGVDGSGKSSTTKELKKWMSSQIDNKQFYLGEGDGKTSLYVSVMKRLLNFYRMRRKDGSKNVAATESNSIMAQSISNTKKKASFRRKVFAHLRISMILNVEHHNMNKIRKMNSYRNIGGISFTDRYPQTESVGCNDGPKVPPFTEVLGDSRYIQRCKRNEEKCLSIVEHVKPDLIFRLNITAETSMRRKPEQKNIKVYQKKIDLLNDVRFKGARIIDIDAEQPREQELLEIKRIIWNAIE